MKVLFSVNLHDNEGDVYEEGIYIHIDNRVIIHFESLKELEDFSFEVQRNLIPEIRENHPELK